VPDASITARHQPASKKYVSEIFHLLDKDHSGVLTREEFSSVMKILYSQVFTRIVIQWSLTLMSEFCSLR
jgi:Ca2+-binding EF-hand superfamily protein